MGLLGQTRKRIDGPKIVVLFDMEQIKKPLTIHVQTYKERAKKSNVRAKLSHVPRGMHLIQ